MLDLDELEAKAKAATPGPWERISSAVFLEDSPHDIAHVKWIEDGEFIAAANPKAILALIRELREARAAVAAEREACAAQIQGWNTAMTDKLADAIRARGEKGGEKC